MTILDVEKVYNQLGAVHNCIFSNFKICSIDTNQRPHCFLVNNLTSCINFDLVKNAISSTRKYSVDSLYISKTTNSVFFVEFKNSSYYGSFHKTTRKAFCSIFIHNDLCNYKDYSFCKNVLCFVISINKENELLARKSGLVGAMLRVAGYTIDINYKKELNSKFMQHISSKSDSSLPFKFVECLVVFDGDFDDFVSSII